MFSFPPLTHLFFLIERVKQERQELIENYAQNVKLLKKAKRQDLLDKQRQLLTLLRSEKSNELSEGQEEHRSASQLDTQKLQEKQDEDTADQELDD